MQFLLNQDLCQDLIKLLRTKYDDGRRGGVGRKKVFASCLPSRPIYAPLFFAIPCYFTDQNLSSANTEGR